MAKKKLKQHRIERDWCKGCGICVEFCPKKVLELDERGKAVARRVEDCIACRLCELRCPDLAIEVVVDEEKENEDGQGRDDHNKNAGREDKSEDRI